MTPIEKIRNLAIVAHIDHGKTTLIDAIFKAAHTFRENARVEERVMDSNELEKERGITIRAKHCTVEWYAKKISNLKSQISNERQNTSLTTEGTESTEGHGGTGGKLLSNAAKAFTAETQRTQRNSGTGFQPVDINSHGQDAHATTDEGPYKINIIDTPGHADFSGEVERVLSMVDSVLLLVDANEGPMPQTRYVLMRALKLGLKPIVMINKIDRPNADAMATLDKTFDLFLELGASDAQADFPVLYGSALHGWIVKDHETEPPIGMDALFQMIIDMVHPPQGNLEAPFQMQVCSLAWNDHIGQIGCGRVLQGRHKVGEPLTRTRTRWIRQTQFEREDAKARREAEGTGGKLLSNAGGKVTSVDDAPAWQVVGSDSAKSTHLWVTRGLKREEVEEVAAGDIVWISGPKEIGIGDTLSAPELENPALQPLEIEEPTVAMFFLVNNGPLAGQDGKVMTLRQIKERLERELRVNVALRMEDLGRPDGVKVSGRGELHLAILIEEMRREGMELCVSRPEVITKVDEQGKTLEPIEQLIVNIPPDYQGVVIEKLAKRRGEMKGLYHTGTGILRLEYEIPTRGLIGYRGEFLTDTRGLGIMSSRFIGYGHWRGEVVCRTRGSMVSTETGEAQSWQLENLQQRGALFVAPMEKIYVGMIIGENARDGDMQVNPCKKKVLGNYRASVKEIDEQLETARKMSLDAALAWIGDDELVEVTPGMIRLRKVVLHLGERKKMWAREQEIIKATV